MMHCQYAYFVIAEYFVNDPVMSAKNLSYSGDGNFRYDTSSKGRFL